MSERKKKREIPGMMPRVTDPRLHLLAHISLLQACVRRLSHNVDELATVLHCQAYAGRLTGDVNELRNAIERRQNELT
jgi:hypothetical protein